MKCTRFFSLLITFALQLTGKTHLFGEAHDDGDLSYERISQGEFKSIHAARKGVAEQITSTLLGTGSRITVGACVFEVYHLRGLGAHPFTSLL